MKFELRSRSTGSNPTRRKGIRHKNTFKGGLNMKFTKSFVMVAVMVLALVLFPKSF